MHRGSASHPSCPSPAAPLPSGGEPLSAAALPDLLPVPLRARLAQGRVWRLGAPGAQLACHVWQAEAGAAQQRPVVLLHGGSGSWTHWLRNIVPLLDAGRRVLALDLPGFGDSDLPAGGDSSVSALAARLAACWPQLMQHLAGGRTPDLLGFSLGGLTAGLLVAGHDVPVHRLVLVGAPGMGLPVQSLGLKGWRHLPRGLQQQAVHRHNLATLMLYDADRIDTLALQIHAANVVRDRLPRRRRARPDALLSCLGRLSCPVHAIYGAHDVLYGECLSELARVLAEAAPGFAGLQLIQQAGHWVQFEAPDAFNAALLRILSG